MPKKEQKYFEGVGRRKTSIARARIFIKKSSAGVLVNDKHEKDFFLRSELRSLISAPLRATDMEKKCEIIIKVKGGGIRGQADACRLAISRALVKFNGDFYKTLRDLNYLSRDPRKKERKKAGLKKARRAPQWQKR
jgi:small subunit ribosomal protein S9